MAIYYYYYFVVFIGFAGKTLNLGFGVIGRGILNFRK
jgi:hypothetical protein